MDKKEKKPVSKETRRRRTKLVARFLKGSKRYFIIAMISAVMITLTEMISPQLIRMTVDNAIGGAEGEYPDFVMQLVDRFGGFEYLGKHLWIMALAVVAVALVQVAAQYCFRVYNTKGSETMVKTMRDSLFTHIEHLPFAWHMNNHTGDVIQRCTSDINTIRNFISEQLTSVLRIIFLVVLSLFFMFSMNVKLTLISMIIAPFTVGYAVIFHKQIERGFRECDENEGKLSEMVQENLTGVRVVRAFGRERFERDRFEAHNEYYTSLWSKLAGTMSTYWSVQDILGGLNVMIVVVAGAVFCIKGSLRAGEYIAFISYSYMLTWPLRMLGRMITEMSKAGVSLERIEQIMRADSESDPDDAGQADMSGDIVFDHVSFSYDGSKEILHDISFEMKSGTTLGILGGTGSGKSTMMLLLDKMYSLPEGCGTISIGGTDIRKIKTDFLRSNIGIVLQEPFLFSRSIADNIGLARGRISLEEIREAAKATCLDDTVCGFAKGYDTFVGERGVTLSGGQKQRAAIAGMLVRNTPVMIFDDSLSAVDTETDAKIRAELEKRFGSASIIIISHRITTLSKADKILVLDGGSVVEEGTHDELKSAGGIYQRIYEIQSGSGKEAAV